VRSRTGVRWGAVVSAAAILVTGCSGGETGAGTKRVTLGSALGIDEAPDLTAIQRQSQELVAQCMTDAGWEYLPVQYPDQTVINNPSEDDELARIKLEGLGVAYSLLNDPATSSIYDGLSTDFVNPNDDYVATLSEDEKAAYEDSLFGTAEEQAQSSVTYSWFDPETGNGSGYTASQSGCQGEADAAVMRDVRTQTPEDTMAMMRYFTDLQTRFEADPRTMKLGVRWVSCIKESGYDYASPDTFQTVAHADFSAKATAVAGADAFSHPTDGWTPEQLTEYEATHTQEEVDALFDTQTEFTADQRTQLEALVTQEIAVALTEHECSASLKDESADIYADVEEQYALEHQDELAALAASMAGDK
jgi:hypothetical protein